MHFRERSARLLNVLSTTYCMLFLHSAILHRSTAAVYRTKTARAKLFPVQFCLCFAFPALLHLVSSNTADIVCILVSIVSWLKRPHRRRRRRRCHWCHRPRPHHVRPVSEPARTSSIKLASTPVLKASMILLLGKANKAVVRAQPSCLPVTHSKSLSNDRSKHQHSRPHHQNTN
jgi:hypothetical protein